MYKYLIFKIYQMVYKNKIWMAMLVLVFVLTFLIIKTTYWTATSSSHVHIIKQFLIIWTKGKRFGTFMQMIMH